MRALVLRDIHELEQSGALSGGVPRVHAVDGRRLGALLEEVFTTEGSGTLVVAEADETPAEPM